VLVADRSMACKPNQFYGMQFKIDSEKIDLEEVHVSMNLKIDAYFTN